MLKCGHQKKFSSSMILFLLILHIEFLCHLCQEPDGNKVVRDINYGPGRKKHRIVEVLKRVKKIELKRAYKIEN